MAKRGKELLTSDEWFTVSREGLGELQRSRRKVDVTKELVSNAFDEMQNGVTEVLVTVAPAFEEDEQGVRLTVEDDGAGFRDIEHAWQLNAPTDKRLDPTLRGRYNLGEKEFFSLARWGVIETVGKTVEFRMDGKRVVYKTGRRKGTRVSAFLAWSNEDVVGVAVGLMYLRPPVEVSYKVNGETVSRIEPVASREEVMPTVLQDSPSEPMRPTRRRTVVDVFREHDKGTAYLYELGVRVQSIEGLYSADVQQKIPMPPNRDTVSEGYLKRLYAVLLSATHDLLPEAEFSETWVRTGLESSNVADEAVHSVVEHRYGGQDQVVFTSPNKDANMRAVDDGKLLLNGRHLSGDERAKLRDVGGIKSAYELYGKVDPKPTDHVAASEVLGGKEFADWVKALGSLLELNATVQFVRTPTSTMIACCTANSSSPQVMFNVALLDDEFFIGRGVTQLELIIHEYAHAYGNGDLSHGMRWGDSATQVGAIFAGEAAAGNCIFTE